MKRPLLQITLTEAKDGTWSWRLDEQLADALAPRIMVDNGVGLGYGAAADVAKRAAEKCIAGWRDDPLNGEDAKAYRTMEIGAE